MASTILNELETFGPERCKQLDYGQAVDYTRRLARSHYENFSVVGWLLPRRLRDDFRNVYAFCRWADDLADESGDPNRNLQLLDWWRCELDACYDQRPRHPVFIALGPTIQKHDIPRKPFDDLIDAFQQDQTVNRYQSWDQVLDYCTRSAEPVGRIVLYLCGYRDEQRQRLSDATCTALQLTNFWQDVRRDILERDRVYVPSLIASQHSLDIETMVNAVRIDADAEPCESCVRSGSVGSAGMRAIRPAFRSTLKELVKRTWPLFECGRRLWPMVAPDVRLDIELFTRGGESILKMIQRQQCDTLQRRPKLGRSRKITLLVRALIGKLVAGSSA